MKCRYHGDLTHEQLIKKGKNKFGNPIYRCKACMKEMHQKYYELNKEVIREAQHQYRMANRDTWLKSKSDSRKKHLEKNRDKNNERKRIWDQQQRDKLGDRHIKKLIVKRSNLSETLVTPEMIEFKRAIILLKKGIKDKLINKKESKDEN